MGKRASAWLTEIQQLREVFGPGSSAPKRRLLEGLAQGRLSSADEVHQLHEILCFLRAYPDDRPLLKLVEGMLKAFADRKDFGRYRKALANTGIAGTLTYYRFFWFTARWLARRWPEHLTIHWKEFARAAQLTDFLPLLLPYAEMHTLEDTSGFDARSFVELLKSPDETDAAFLVRRFEGLRASSFGREALYDHIDPPLCLSPGKGTPNRTLARHRKSPVFYQEKPFRRERPSFPRDIREVPKSVTYASTREANELIRLARSAMVARDRDFDTFVHANPHDVRVVDWGDGLQFACFSAVPERRMVLDAVYGFLTLKNGVPIGYVLSHALLRSAGVGYNVFETFRGGESALIYGRVLAATHHLFAADAFYVDPYQLGYENDEALRSGAWWFYYKLGFRPRDPQVQKLLKRELALMRRNPRHRSSRAMLSELSSQNMYYYLGRPRRDVMGEVSLGNIGLAVSRYLAGRFGSDREKAVRVCSRETAELLGVRSMRSWSAGERLAWKRWSPLVVTMREVDRWSAAERELLARVIRAKGGPRESDFVHLCNGHRRLNRAIAKLAR